MAVDTLAGGRAQVRLSLTALVVRVDGTVVAEHPRSWVPPDVTVDPVHVHARAVRPAREASYRLEADIDVPAVDPQAYDRLAQADVT